MLSDFSFLENVLVTYSQVVKGWLVRGMARGCAAKHPLLLLRSRCGGWMNAALSISIRQAEHDVLSVCLRKQEQSKHWVKVWKIYENNSFYSTLQLWPLPLALIQLICPYDLKTWLEFSVRNEGALRTYALVLKKKNRILNSDVIKALC